MYDNIHRSLFEIVTFFNRSKQDERLIKRAGVSLDVALFPLLMRIEMQGPIGIVDLAEQVNRDHSTISRQVQKLLSLGLVNADDKTSDKRANKVLISDNGRKIVEQIIQTRHSMMSEALSDWTDDELAMLGIVLRKLTTSLDSFSHRK